MYHLRTERKMTLSIQYRNSHSCSHFSLERERTIYLWLLVAGSSDNSLLQHEESGIRCQRATILKVPGPTLRHGNIPLQKVLIKIALRQFYTCTKHIRIIFTHIPLYLPPLLPTSILSFFEVPCPHSQLFSLFSNLLGLSRAFYVTMGMELSS